MKIISIAFILSLTIFFSACKQDVPIDLQDEDYLIFGHVFGECVGEECIEIFKLTESQLFEDIVEATPAENRPYDFVELDNELFEKVSDLPAFFPSQLRDSSSMTFGCPDCLHQGGLYIELSEDGEVKRWEIDNAISQTPAFLHEFSEKVKEKIRLINE